MTRLRCIAAALLLLSCSEGSDPRHAADAQRRIQDWLMCEDCTDGELRAVVKLGAQAVPSLIATLRDGLSPASQALFEEQLGSFYDTAARKGRTTRQEFVAHHVGNREALVRVRAARALGRIGTPAAQAALREALVIRQRPSVEESIRRAIEEAAP